MAFCLSMIGYNYQLPATSYVSAIKPGYDDWLLADLLTMTGWNDRGYQQ